MEREGVLKELVRKGQKNYGTGVGQGMQLAQKERSPQPAEAVKKYLRH